MTQSFRRLPSHILLIWFLCLRRQHVFLWIQTCDLKWHQQKTLELRFPLIVATFFALTFTDFFLIIIFIFSPASLCDYQSAVKIWSKLVLYFVKLWHAWFFFVTTISSAKCDVFVLIFQTKIVPRNVVHVSCCFLHTLVYITFTSLFSIVCAKTEQFNGFQRYPLNWWFWYDKHLIRSHLRASTCALRLSAWQSTWTLLHLQCCQKLWGCLVTLFP